MTFQKIIGGILALLMGFSGSCQETRTQDQTGKLLNLTYSDSSWIDYKYDNAGNPIGRYRHSYCDRYLAPAIGLSGDSILCFGDTVRLLSPPASHYLWSTHDTIQSITADTSGFYTLTITYFNGCQKSSTQQIVVRPQPKDSFTATICANQSYSFASHTLTVGGIYFDTLASVTGCDSIVKLTLTVLPLSFDTISQSICQGRTFSFNGMALSTAGTYFDTLTSANGCDSIIALNLTVLPNSSTTLNASICNGQRYNFNGQSLTVSGIYFDTVPSANLCDSVITLNLTVWPTYSDSSSQSICIGKSYNFYGHPLTSSGIYIDTLRTINGCDSIMILNLIVLPNSDSAYNQSICFGQSYSFNGSIITTTGIYVDTLVSANGCDSVVTLGLTVLPFSGSVLNTSICYGQTYSFNGQFLNSAGMYFDTIPNARGCDSIVTLNLTVLPNSDTALYATLCSGQVYNFKGQSLNANGTYFDTVRSANLCDSIITLHLTVLPTYADSSSHSICYGTSYNFFGKTLSTPGRYIDTLSTIGGCDSIIILNLSVLPNSAFSFNQSICYGQSYLFNSKALTATGSYVDTLVSANGCDSVVTVNLSVYPYSGSVLNTSICYGQTYSFKGQLLSATGTYFDTLPNARGCDSVLTLNLTVRPNSDTTLYATICNGHVCNFKGRSLSTSGTYYDTVSSANLCDSVIILNLTVLPTYTLVQNQSICAGQTYSFFGESLTNSGTYRDTLHTINGCDSVIVLNLTVNPVYRDSNAVSICQWQSYRFYGQTLSSAGIYNDTLHTMNGCDSIQTLNLSILPVAGASQSQSICYGQSFIFNGKSIATSGIYHDTLQGINGCDSIVTLNLSVLLNSDSTIYRSICSGQGSLFAGVNQTVGGSYNDTLVSANGCDSVVTLRLTILPTYIDSIARSICYGKTYDFYGRSLISSGRYIDTLTTIGGCDSIVILDLTVLPNSDYTYNTTICFGQNYLFNGRGLTTPGVYVDTLVSANGCNSVVSVNLTVYPYSGSALSSSICAGHNYSFGGQLLTATGTYFDTIANMNGCDSVAILHLTVLPNSDTALYVSVCNGESFSFHSQILSVGGIYYDTVPSANMCDSVITLNLTVLPTYTIVQNQSICAGQIYPFFGQNFNTSGTYNDTLSTMNGCDSVIVLNLTVNPIYRDSSSINICQGQGQFFYGQFISSGGFYNDTLHTANGCDSIQTLEVTILPLAYTTVTDSVCNGSTFSFNGQNIGATGIYRDTLQAANGCDSVVTLNLTVLPNSDSTINRNICLGEIYLFKGVNLSTTGLYQDTLISANGCDSIVTLDLIVLPTYRDSSTQTICNGKSFGFYGQNLSASGKYIDTLSTISGCDSIVVLDLIVLPNSDSTYSQSICFGQSYLFNGSILTATGTYIDTLVSANGCDSVITVNLSVNPYSGSTLNTSICSGHTYSFNGQLLSTTGTYFDTIGNMNGCDSVVILHLTVLPNSDTTLYVSICNGESFSFRSQNLSVGGTYFDTIPSANLCDSVITLNLTVLPTYTIVQNQNICAGQIYPFFGQNLSGSGTYYDTLTTMSGCDSVIVLNLTTNPIYRDSGSVNICQGQSLLFNGQLISTGGFYTDTLHTINGCDSIQTLQVTILPLAYTTLVDTICDGSVFSFNGQNIGATGMYRDTLRAANGCDSVVTLSLTILPNSAASISRTICSGQTYLFKGASLSATGSYKDTLTSANGCDSILTLDLIVLPTYMDSSTQAICYGRPYDFYGQNLVMSRRYVDTLSTVSGCDSIIVLDLIVLPNSDSTFSQSICSGQSYLFNGSVITMTGRYVDTMVSANGCDSVVTLNLTVRPNSETRITTSICAGQVYNFNGANLTTNGTYYDTLASANSCDSVVILNLAVLPTYTITQNQSICDGQTYSFYGMNLSNTGTYYDTLQSVTGCDSVIELSFTVNPTFRDSSATIICEGQNLLFYGRIVDSSGFYSDTLLTISGCDSIQTLHLTVLPLSRTSLSQSICSGHSLIFNGQNISITGTYSDTLPAVNGCDSIIILNLSVLPNSDSVIYRSICSGLSLSFNGTNVSATGYYYDTLTSSNGCDSIVTLQLTVLPVYKDSITHSICYGKSYDFYGNTLNSSGTYIDTLSTISGCDSIIVLNLSVLPNSDSVYIKTICFSQSYLFNGRALTASGTYSDTLASANGCDSVISVVLNVLPYSGTTLNTSICNGRSYTFSGRILTTTGIYRDTMSNANGCDSVIVLNLTVLPNSDTTLYVTICNGEAYNFGGQNLSSGGTYFDTIASANLCDSVIILHLTQLQTYTTIQNQSICTGQSYSFFGQNISNSGTYFDTLQTVNGCDSVIKLNLIVNPTYRDTNYVSICQYGSYNFFGQILSSPGIYSDTFVSAKGCDSIISAILSVRPIATTVLYDSICYGFTYSFNGALLNSTGTYIDTFTAANQCDSIVILHLEVLPIVTDTILVSICNGQSYNFNNSVLVSSGTYIDTFSSINGCDSFLVLNLTVLPTASSRISANICDGQTYLFGNRTLSATAIYIDTLTALNGCDSIATLNLTVLMHSGYSYSETICSGQTYSFNGLLLNMTGTYADTLASANGCDSIVVLNLLVQPISSDSITATICSGTTYLLGSQNLVNAGIYHDTLIGVNSCDSIITFNLIVLPIITTTLNQTICSNHTYLFASQNINASGIYSDTLQAANGCDSIVILNLTVLPVSTGYDSATICDNQTYYFHNQTLIASGIYLDTLINVKGCDSVLTFRLTILPTYADTNAQSICYGKSYGFFGKTLMAAGTYSDTLSSISGCDSIIVLNLIVLPNSDSAYNQSICFGQSYLFNGTALTATGVYVDTLVSANGCDSLVTLNLTVLPYSGDTLSTTICNGHTYSLNGQLLNVTGTYFDTVPNINGCDSVVMLNLTVLPNSDTILYASICNGQVYNFNGQNLTTTGTYFDTVPSANSCDSFITLNLTVWPTFTVNQSQSICNGSSYSFYGQSLTSTGAYYDTLTTVNGCDSIIALALTVNPTYQDTSSVSICQYDTYDFYGQALSFAGVYSDTFSTVNGCDSIISVNLTVLPISTTVLYDSICNGFTFLFNSAVLNSTGTYIDTLISTNGCDSIVTLNLTVLPISQDTVVTSICSGNSFNFNGQLLTIGGTYIDALTAASGCDSIVTLQLTVLPLSNYSYTDTICAGNTYNFNGSTLSSSGTYIDTFTATNGCDSFVTLSLTVLPTHATTLTDSICSGQTLLFRGQSLSLTGTYIDTLIGVNGCDSFVTLNLTILPISDTALSATICSGQSYLFNGLTLTSTGTYVDTLNNIHGCDSIVTLTLTVQPTYTDTINTTICNGQAYLFYGMSLTNQGIYSDTLSSFYGCDSIIVLNLTINSTYQDTMNTTICQGGSYLFYGQTLTTSGLYNDTLSTITGCDSIKTIMLTVLPNSDTTLTQSICAGQTYSFNNATLDTSGIYSDTLSSVNGCDSIVTLHLTVNAVYSFADTQYICYGDSFYFGGGYISFPGLYHDSLTSLAGCDSIHNLVLLWRFANYAYPNVSICYGGTYNFYGAILNQAGQYLDTLTSMYGCDSIVTLNLTLLPIIQHTLYDSVCYGQSYLFNGQQITNAGIYRDTLVSPNGCDSVVILHLNVTNPIRSAISQSICAGQSYLFNGQNLSSAGVYQDTLTNSTGCDSIVTLTLNVMNTLLDSISVSICAGNSYNFHSHMLYASGTYIDTLTSVNGCDSIEQLSLSVNPLPTPSIYRNGDTLHTDDYSHIQWYLNGDSLHGQTNSTLVFTQNGYYTVSVIDSNRCSDTVSVWVTNVGIRNLTLENIELIPNPTNGKVTILNLINGQNYSLAVYDMQGKRVAVYAVSNTNPSFDISPFASGVYQIQIVDANRETLVKRLVKY